MAKIKNGGAAFPRPASEDTTCGTLPDGNRMVDGQDGMTLRQYYAAQALPGILAAGFHRAEGAHDSNDRGYLLCESEDGINFDVHHYPATFARLAFEVADALIAHEQEGH